MSIFPTSVEPVNVIFLTFGFSMIVFAIFEDDPVTRLITPFGNPASSHNSINFIAVIGLSLEGLIITVQPAASAGPIFLVSIAAGKFHGVIAATTPTGFLHTCNRLLSACECIVSQYTRLPSSAHPSITVAA